MLRRPKHSNNEAVA